MKVTIIVISIFLLMAANCKKERTDSLPPATHTGAFTFGCKVDGKVYTASGKEGGVLGNGFVSYHLFQDSLLFITARNTTHPDFGIHLSIKYPGSTGTYSMKEYPFQGVFTDDSNGTITGSDNTYTTTESYTGSVTITYFNGTYTPPFTGTILAGTFQMNAVNGEGKTIQITAGRFDIGQ